MIPRQYPRNLVFAVRKGYYPPFRNVDGDSMPEIAGRSISHWGDRDVIGTVRSEYRALAHVYPTVSIAGYALRLQQKVLLGKQIIGFCDK